MNQKKNSEMYVALLPKIVLIAGAIDAVVFAVFAFISLLSNSSVFPLIVFFVFSALGIVMIIAYCNCRIYYDKQRIIIKNYFGIEHEYSYQDIGGKESTPKECCLYIGKKRLELTKLSSSHLEFYVFAVRRYRQLCGASIPNHEPKPKRGWDPFNGNIFNPGEFIFIYILIFIVIIVGIVLAISAMIKDSRLDLYETVFINYETEGDVVILISDEMMRFEIDEYPEDFDPEILRVLCDGKTTVSVKGVGYNHKGGVPYISVRSLVVGEKELLPAEAIQAARRRVYYNVLLIVFGLAIIWIVFILLSIRVGRDPEKYHKYVKLFFQPGYVKRVHKRKRG